MQGIHRVESRGAMSGGLKGVEIVGKSAVHVHRSPWIFNQLISELKLSGCPWMGSSSMLCGITTLERRPFDARGPAPYWVPDIGRFCVES